MMRTALARRSFMRRLGYFVISIVSVTIFFLLILSPRAYAQSVNQTNSNFITPNTAENVPPNLHNWVQTLMIDTMSALSCQLSGIDPTNPNGKCLGVNQETGKIGYVENGGGLIGVLSYGIGQFYRIPFKTSDYANYLANNFTPIKSAYAEQSKNPCNIDTGICGLKPFIQIWAAARDLVYMLFVIIFIIIGLAIMFRVHIDPRTVMTVQNQIPKIIMGILLVTFSFAIAGLLIDAMYVVTYLFFNVLSKINIPNADVANTVSNLNPLYLQGHNPLTAMSQGTLGGNFFETARGISDALTNVVRNFLGIREQSLISSFNPIDQITSVVGALADPNKDVSMIERLIDILSFGAALGAAAQVSGFTDPSFVGFSDGGLVMGLATYWAVFGLAEQFLRVLLPNLIIYIIVVIALIFALVRLWFTLLIAYINVLLDVIFAPFWLLAGLIPGGKAGFGFWLKDIISNLAAFPVALGMLMLGQIFATAIQHVPDAHKGTVFIPPLVGIPADNPGVLGGLIGMGFIFMTPQVLTMVKKAIGAPQIDLGPIAPPIGAGIAAPLRIARTGGRIVGRTRKARSEGKGIGESLARATFEEATNKYY